MNESANPYDAIPYLSQPFKHSHPDRLKTIAHLYGLESPDIQHCRVLELGCGGGENLIPIACDYPQSSFYGIDLAQYGIEAGTNIINRLELKNIRLEQKNIMDVDENFGSFDYIIAHGVYSWVPEQVQRKVLQICKQNLSSQGVAYISYNTLPGWHTRQMFRDMLLYHTNKYPDPKSKMEQARAFMNFLEIPPNAQNTAYGALLREEKSVFAGKGDWFLFHEHLETMNTPFYFHEFTERAETEGLQYLGDADFQSLYTHYFSKKAMAQLDAYSSNSLEREQYLDFLRNRKFRRSLVCHAKVELKPQIIPEAVKDLYIASSVEPVSPSPEFESSKAEKFKLRNKSIAVETNNPYMKTCFMILKDYWPQAVPFTELNEQIKLKLSPEALALGEEAYSSNPSLFARELFQIALGSFIELRCSPLNCSHRLGAFPRTSLLARYQGGFSKRITNYRHEIIELDDDFAHQLLTLLDGSRSHEDLEKEMLFLLRSGKLNLSLEGKQANDSEKNQKIVAQYLQMTLRKLKDFSLLTE